MRLARLQIVLKTRLPRGVLAAGRAICQGFVRMPNLALQLDSLKEPDLCWVHSRTQAATRTLHRLQRGVLAHSKSDVSVHDCRTAVEYLVITHSILALELCPLMFGQRGLESLRDSNLLAAGAWVEV